MCKLSAGLLTRLLLGSKVFKQCFYMKFFGHPTAKPTMVLSNTPQILHFQHGPMKKSDLKSDVKTTIKKVRKSDGKPTFSGSAALKGTQNSYLQIQKLYKPSTYYITLSALYKP